MATRPPILALLVLVLALGFPLPARAEAPVRAYIPTASLSPLVAPRGLPRHTGWEDPPGLTTELRLDWATHAVADVERGRSVALDGETRRYSLAVSGPVGGAWTGRMELDLIHHTGGFLDPAIKKWHRLWGMDQGPRDRYPSHRLLFDWEGREGEGSVIQQEAVAGPGDVGLTLTRPLAQWQGVAWGLGLRLEAPTGSAGDMLGSGGWDAAGWLAGEQTRTLPWGPIHLHGALGALRSQPGDWLTERLRPWAPFARAAMAWEPWRGWALKGQIDSHGPLYRGSMMPLGQTAVELRLIGRVPVKRRWRLELGFSEDVAVGTAPDITLHAHLGRAW